MPKLSKIQASFDTGQISKSVYGRVDNPRYEAALEECLNYLPIVQGPLIRRPGTKFAAFAKDASKPPVLIPFQFSIGQNYVLEVGDKYIHFFTNEGLVITSSNTFLVAGIYGQQGRLASLPFTATRGSVIANPGELVLSTSALIPGLSPLVVATPYAWADLKSIKWAQKQDVLYLTHPSYPPYKLSRTGFNQWDLRAVLFQDGPYLDLNTYETIADGANIFLTPNFTGEPTLVTGPAFQISLAFSAGSSFGNAIVIEANGHTFNNGDQVCVLGVQGTTEANNVSTGSTVWAFTNSSPQQAYWTAANVNGNSLQLAGSQFQHTFFGSTGVVYPALFQLITGSSGTTWADVQVGSSQLAYRNIGLENNGQRYWGQINQVFDAAHAQVEMAQDNILPDTSSITIWQMGVFNQINGWPSCCTFHQDRLVFAGCPGVADEIDASMTSLYEVFSSSGSNYQVNNNNALQFNLLAQDVNNIKWMQSNALGLLAGTQSAEWAVNPATTDPALYPTNIKATQVTFFGSMDTDAVQVANAALYIQRAQRKLRELLYFWQVGSFRSTNLSELSESITLPTITKIVSQKEPHSIVWGLRGDGALTALTYKRDDVTLQAQAGWSYHNFGGFGAPGQGLPPITNSMAVIPSGDTTFDELWVVNQRFINGTNAVTIEYMTKPFDDNTPQYLAYHFDCGATFNSSIVVTNISVAGSCVITAPSHGLANSSTIRFYNTVGINQTTTDVNGNIVTSSMVNGQTFVVASASTNQFFIQDFLGNYINTGSASTYVGSALVNNLITSISGINWLENETVSVLADGAIQANTTISNTGVLNLSAPAAIVSFGYQYNSDAQMLRTKDGSAQGTSIGSTRRCNRVAFMLHNVGDLQFGPSFTNLVPAEFYRSDAMTADVAPPLFDGIYRDNMASSYGFNDTICFRQNSGLPGMIQAVVRFIEEQDV